MWPLCVLVLCFWWDMCLHFSLLSKNEEKAGRWMSAPYQKLACACRRMKMSIVSALDRSCVPTPTPSHRRTNQRIRSWLLAVHFCTCYLEVGGSFVKDLLEFPVRYCKYLNVRKKSSRGWLLLIDCLFSLVSTSNKRKSPIKQIMSKGPILHTLIITYWLERRGSQ